MTQMNLTSMPWHDRERYDEVIATPHEQPDNLQSAIPLKHKSNLHLS